MKNIRKFRTLVQGYLDSYSILDKEILAKRNEILGIGSSIISDSPRGSEISNPTHRQAIRLLIATDELENAKRCIEQAVRCIKKSEIIDYFHMRYVKEYTNVKIQRELYISRRTSFRYNTVLLKEVAREMGLL